MKALFRSRRHTGRLFLGPRSKPVKLTPMKSWRAPSLPTLPTKAPAVEVFDTARGEQVPLDAPEAAQLYVCGITPYDATHLGHAATYLAFDLLNRAWRNSGREVRYVQNVTDVDDPLLERAQQTGEAWTALAQRETELFGTDMEALRVFPPDHYIGAVESIPQVLALISDLQSKGAIYQVGPDYYFDISKDDRFGTVSGMPRDEMLRLFAERGGDPDVAGKRNPLDCLVWRGERPGEPHWLSQFGEGRPGWHIECTAIALRYLGYSFDVQGGGSDLIFPHHEMCASEAHVADPDQTFAKVYVHVGMVALDGEKMSKSRGNLVLVSRLRDQGVDPMAIRIAIAAHHYRSDWEWQEEDLKQADARLSRWRTAAWHGRGGDPERVETMVLHALATDLDAPRALALVDQWADQSLAGDHRHEDAGSRIANLVDAALGITL
jgi:L-cysteine:1D-myo-inositol 2-amino-2-deoxy-alpha-D-glucopyranoside ligase